MLLACYRYTQVGCYEETATQETPKVDRMPLSPHASSLEATDCQSANGFSCCSSCKSSMKKGMMPKYAIANNYTFGTPTKSLLELNLVEIALDTPVKTYGYCFRYTGGRQKQLKGTLAYYEVEMKCIAAAAVHLDVPGLNKHKLVFLYGKMTLVQQGMA